MEVKLHLGCGNRNFGAEWVHIDGGYFPHVTHRDVTKLVFEDNSVDLIYSSHLVAYFSRVEIIRVLAEWKRVLKPGGILMIATPDFDAMLDITKKGAPLEKLMGLLYGEIKINGEYSYHKQTYNFQSLSLLLNKLGFKDVDDFEWKEQEFSRIDDCSKAYFPHDPEAIKTQQFRKDQTLMSLNIQCRK